jgi:hypothetical protein
MGDGISIIWGFIWGTIGLGFFIYGKKNKKIIPFVSGIVLMLLPYVVPNLIFLAIISIICIGLPYFVRL